MSGERFPALSLEEMTPEQRRIATTILNSPRKNLTGPFQALLRSPELADAVQKAGEYLRFRSAIPKRVNEMAILMTARRWMSQFEWYAHEKLATEVGLDVPIIAALREGRRPEGMQHDEAVIYEFCHELLASGAPGAAATEAVIGLYGDRGLVDLTGVVGFYCLVSMILNVAGFPVPEGVEPPLKPL